MGDYVYHDRKMMKWIPFNALLEQSEYLEELYNKRNKMEQPTLSPDQEADLNYTLETAYITREEVAVSYYEAGVIQSIQGRITKTDNYHKKIYINGTPISALQIIDMVLI